MNMDVCQPAAVVMQDTELQGLTDDTGPRLVK